MLRHPIPFSDKNSIFAVLKAQSATTLNVLKDLIIRDASIVTTTTSRVFHRYDITFYLGDTQIPREFARFIIQMGLVTEYRYNKFVSHYEDVPTAENHDWRNFAGIVSHQNSLFVGTAKIAPFILTNLLEAGLVEAITPLEMGRHTISRYALTNFAREKVPLSIFDRLTQYYSKLGIEAQETAAPRTPSVMSLGILLSTEECKILDVLNAVHGAAIESINGTFRLNEAVLSAESVNALTALELIAISPTDTGGWLKPTMWAKISFKYPHLILSHPEYWKTIIPRYNRKSAKVSFPTYKIENLTDNAASVLAQMVQLEERAQDNEPTTTAAVIVFKSSKYYFGLSRMPGKTVTDLLTKSLLSIVIHDDGTRILSLTDKGRDCVRTQIYLAD